MGQSFEMPKDRPYRIWCCNCQEWIGPEDRDPKNWPPDDLTDWRHASDCAYGSMRFVYDDVAPKLPDRLSTSHCGDSTCRGGCLDPLCLPPEIESLPVKAKQPVGVNAKWRVASIVLFAGWVCLGLAKVLGYV